MKRDKIYTALTAWLLGSLISVSAVLCLATGFSLTVDHLPRLLMLCSLCALCCGGLFQLRLGTGVFLLASAFLCGWLWRRGTPDKQILYLIQHLSQVYNNAYHWGVLKLADLPQSADYPLMILGCGIAAAVSRCICTGKGTFLALSAASLPLALCLVVTDTVPQPLFLFGLLAGGALLILTGGVRQQSVSQANRLTAVSAVPVMLALTVLFLAVPQEGYVNQSEQLRQQLLSWVQTIPTQVENTLVQMAQPTDSNPTATVRLAGLGKRQPSQVQVMTVTADTGGTLYLRGQDFDSYSGTAWTATAQRAEAFTQPDTMTGSLTIQTISARKMRFLPYYAQGGATLTGGLLPNPDGLLEYHYTVGSLPPIQEAAVSGKYGVLPEEGRYLALPEGTKAAALALLEGKLPESSSNTEIASAIGSYTRSCAVYDLDPSTPTEDAPDFALWFLREAERGYCVHFATAAVVLLRSAGVPARYVTGYMVQTEAGKPIAVTEQSAHAWAEYYEPRLDAWLVLEATPAAPESPVPPVTQPQTLPAEVTVPQTTAVEEAADHTAPATTPNSTEIRKDPAASFAGSLEGIKRFAQVLLLSGLALLILWVQRSLRISLRRQAQAKGPANLRAMKYWQEAQLLYRLMKQEPPETLLHLAQKAKFSQHRLTKEELRCFETHLNTCRQQLRENPWYVRLVQQYVYAAY